MKKLVVVLGVAALATGAVATHFWLGLREEHRKAGEIATRLAAAESVQIAKAAEPQSPEPLAPTAAAADSLPVAQPVAASATPANQKSATSADSPMKGVLAAMATPEGLDATRAMMRGMMTQMYPDVEQELGLTRQEAEKLFDVLSSVPSDSVEMLLGGAQDAAASREMQRKMVEVERAQEAKVSALLGSNRWISCAGRWAPAAIH
jgi:hypothetical protein